MQVRRSMVLRWMIYIYFPKSMFGITKLVSREGSRTPDGEEGVVSPWIFR